MYYVSMVMKRVLYLGIFVLISLVVQIDLLADNYKVTPRRAKDKVAVFGSELRTIMKKSDVIGYVYGTDTVDYVGTAYKACIIAMKDGTQGYVDRSMMLRFNTEEGPLRSILYCHGRWSGICGGLMFSRICSCLSR